MGDVAIGRAFPIGGPVPPELIIGREGEVADVKRRLTEGLSTMVIGERRIGKTSVCNAVCSQIKTHGGLVVQVEVPERPDSEALLQQIVDRCSRMSLEALAGATLTTTRPLIEDLLDEIGVPLDLSLVGGKKASTELPTRDILGLPSRMASHESRPALLFLDELQRVASYADGEQVLADLIDVYGGSGDVVLLADGSEERTLRELFEAPIHFGKLADRVDLAPTIDLGRWREPLTARFASAGLELPAPALEQILQWGEGHPYATMAAARYTALAARRTGTESVGDFDVRMGIDEAQRHLDDDGA